MKFISFWYSLFVDNGDDLPAFSHIVRSDRLVDRSPAVKVMEDEIPQLFLLFRDDADPSLDVLPKNEIIQDHPVEKGSKDTQDHDLFVINQSGGQRHAHS